MSPCEWCARECVSKRECRFTGQRATWLAGYKPYYREAEHVRASHEASVWLLLSLFTRATRHLSLQCHFKWLYVLSWCQGVWMRQRENERRRSLKVQRRPAAALWDWESETKRRMQNLPLFSHSLLLLIEMDPSGLVGIYAVCWILGRVYRLLKTFECTSLLCIWCVSSTATVSLAEQCFSKELCDCKTH